MNLLQNRIRNITEEFRRGTFTQRCSQLSFGILCLFLLECSITGGGRYWEVGPVSIRILLGGLAAVLALPELFRRSDFVNVSITLCDATRDLINAPVFAAANPELLLVNTSRGGIVNEHDLYVALTTGQIRAAASDVFAHEPPASDDPLIYLDNFIATFHIGGSTYESLERVSNRAVDYVFQYTGVAER